MSDPQTLSLRQALDELVGEPIRGIDQAALRLQVTPDDLAVRVERPAVLKRLLGSLVAAASWGGGLRWMHVAADWQPKDHAAGGLRLIVDAYRNPTDSHARQGWFGIEQVLMSEVRKAVHLVGGGEIVSHAGDGEFACEVWLPAVELATNRNDSGAVAAIAARRSA